MTFAEVEDLVGRADRRPAAGPDPGGLRARCRDGGGERDPRRRHEAGVRPRPGDRGDRAGRRGADAGLVPVLACATAGRPAGRSPRSTSSSCATGRRRWTGTAPRRAPRCLRRSSPRPAPATSRPTSASPVTVGSDRPFSAQNVPDIPLTGLVEQPLPELTDSASANGRINCRCDVRVMSEDSGNGLLRRHDDRSGCCREVTAPLPMAESRGRAHRAAGSGDARRSGAWGRRGRTTCGDELHRRAEGARGATRMRRGHRVIQIDDFGPNLLVAGVGGP